MRLGRFGQMVALAGATLLGCGRSNLDIDNTTFNSQGGPGGSFNFAGSGGQGGFGAGGAQGGKNQGGKNQGGAGANQGGFGNGSGKGGFGAGGSVGGACQTGDECDDLDFCTLDQCINNTCVHTLKDFDQDGFIDVACNGDDCDDANFQVKPGASEQCGDGVDNNCNGALDCAEPSCQSSPSCPCVPGQVEVCTGGQDEDCDGLVDCNDPDCALTSPACACEPLEVCGDGLDNDCDGLIDCGDPNCFGTPGCTTCEPSETKCQDTVDEDCDGLVDCADPDCSANPACTCAPTENCSNGKDDDCDGQVDCLDTSCAQTPACACQPTETSCGDGLDNNCNGLFDCDDPACENDVTCTCGSTPEDCADGSDNNCNGLIDCADPACVGTPACKCKGPPIPEKCQNGEDDDCDGQVDCQDDDCLGEPGCTQCKTEVCNDGVDNDCDGKIDCADTDSCKLDPACTKKDENCNNKIDDDFDGKVDCADPDCKNNPVCQQKQSNCSTAKLINASGTYTGDTTGNVGETKGFCGGDAGEAVFRLIITAPTRLHVDTDGTQFDATLYLRKGSCTAGKELACNDDHHNSPQPPPSWPSVAEIDVPVLYPGAYFLFIDGYTVDVNLGPNQGPFTLNVELTPNPKEICGDGIDNDGDVYVDCADSDCQGEAKCQCNPQPSGPEFGVAACNDGLDNDCDGKVDGEDKDCNASDYYATELCNGVDDNGNQIVDDFSCRCAKDSECDQNQGQICYSQSAQSCGPPCDAFVGDVCPFVAPGSVCNHDTKQCAFP